MHKGSQQTLNIGTSVGTTINDLYQQLTQIMKFNRPAQYATSKLGDVKDCCLERAKAEKELKWKPNFSLSVGLKETVKSYNG